MYSWTSSSRNRLDWTPGCLAVCLITSQNTIVFQPQTREAGRTDRQTDARRVCVGLWVAEKWKRGDFDNLLTHNLSRPTKACLSPLAQGKESLCGFESSAVPSEPLTMRTLLSDYAGPALPQIFFLRLRNAVKVYNLAA